MEAMSVFVAVCTGFAAVKLLASAKFKFAKLGAPATAPTSSNLDIIAERHSGDFGSN